MTLTDYSSRKNTTEYQELLRILRSNSPGGAIILGGVGMGKTSLADAVFAASEIPAPVMRLYCSSSLRDVPYGVLSPYLGALESLDKPVEVLREINRVLAETDTGQVASNIMVVEDAQYLDEQSCFVLSLLMENAALKLVAVGTGAIDANSPLAALSESSLLQTIVIQPLNLDGVRAVAESMLTGTLSESSVRTIRIMTGGNPSFVEAYVASCLEQGVLLQDDFLLSSVGDQTPVWIMSRSMPELDSRLTDLVRGVHRLTTDEEQRTLELLALGGPQSTELLNLGGFSYQRMLDAGELRIVEPGRIALNSELYQNVLRLIVPAQRSAELFAYWQETGTKMGLERTPRHVLWGLDIGMPVATEEVLQAAQRAVKEFDYGLAWKLCQGGNISRHSAKNAIFEVQVMMGMGRFYSARSLLLRIIEDLDDAELLGEAFGQLLIVLTNLGTDIPQMRSFEERWEERVKQVQGHDHKAGALAAQHTGQRLLALWTGLNTVDGQRPSPAMLEEFMQDQSLPAEAQIIALLVLCDVHGIAGRNLKAVEISSRIGRILAKDPQLHALYEAKFIFRMGWNLLLAGESERTMEFLDGYRGSSLWLVSRRQGVVTLLEGFSDLLQGRLQRATHRLAEAVTELHMNDPAQVLSLSMHLYRMALKQSGHIGVEQRTPAHPNRHEYEPWNVPEYLGEAPSRQRIFARAVAAAMGEPMGNESLGDFPVIERFVIAITTSEMNDEELAGSKIQQRLLELTANQEGNRVQLLTRMATLREASEGKPFEELAQEALRQGEHLAGVEGLARAAVRHANAGEPRTCGALLRQAARIIEEQHIHPNKYVSRALALTELTARESEIVQLVLTGKNNAQIARTLVVSQRTVEGHLYRVFSKLGISERSELALAKLELGTSQYG